MELCTCKAPVNLASPFTRRAFASTTTLIGLKPSLPLKSSSLFVRTAGTGSRKNSLLRATWSDETSSESKKYGGESGDGVALDDVSSAEKKSYTDYAQPAVVNQESQKPKKPNEESSTDEGEEQPFVSELLDKFDLKLDSEDSYYSLVLYAGGAVVAVWLLSAVVGAVDSIPLFPKLMEVVGLGYSLWFTTRYLLFKKNRKELALKIDELKREVLGAGDD